MSAQKPDVRPAEPQAKSAEPGSEETAEVEDGVAGRARSTRCRAPPSGIAPPPIARARSRHRSESSRSRSRARSRSRSSAAPRRSSIASRTNGDRLRIKYGSSPEVPSEVASAKAAARARLRRRQRDDCREGALLRLPGRAVRDHEDARFCRRARSFTAR